MFTTSNTVYGTSTPLSTRGEAAARNGTDPFALQEAGGWNSLTMPCRYVEAANLANEGVKLD
jgi:hypothetical protein